MRAHLLAVLLGSFVLVHVACSDDETSPPPGSGSSSGLASSSGASSSGSSGASSGGSSGASSSGSSGSDGGDGGGGPVVTSCAMPARADTIRAVNGGNTIGAAGYANKWVVNWDQVGAFTDGGIAVAKARFFDGAAFQAEKELGQSFYGTNNGWLSDGNGRAFMQRTVDASSSMRHILDFATGTITDSAYNGINGIEAMSLATIPGGGAFSFYRNGTSLAVDRWLPADPTWKSTNLTGTPALAYKLHVWANAAGKAAVLWQAGDGTGQTLYISFFDGTSTWTTPATKFFPNAGGDVTFAEGAMLTNGDLHVTYAVGADATIKSMRVHTNGTIDAPVDVGLGTGTGSALNASVVADANDRITIAWIGGGKALARRDLGAGYQPEQDLGAADTYRMDLDRATGNVTVVTYKTSSLSIRGVSPTSNTWTAAVPLTGLGVTNGMYAGRQVATVFDTAGHPTVIAEQELPGPGAFGLSYSKCQ